MSFVELARAVRTMIFQQRHPYFVVAIPTVRCNCGCGGFLYGPSQSLLVLGLN